MKRKLDADIYFTPKQAAEHFNLSLSTVKNYIYAGRLKTLKTPGGHHRIRKSELLATLGDLSISSEISYDFSLRDNLCTIMLSAFRTLGPAGKNLILHAQKVSHLSSEIAKVMAINGPNLKLIEVAGLVHDIGKIGIDRDILLKLGKLTPQEYGFVRRHPSLGEKILSSIRELEDIATIVMQHHERVDGKGYPKGLNKKDIQKEARIISIAEAYDSMVSPHSYKAPISKEMAMAEIIKQRGTQFDRDIVEVFVKTLGNDY